MNLTKITKALTAPSSLIGIGLIVLSVIGWALIPPWIELSRQSRAGALIENYVQTNAPEYADHFTCLLPILTALPPNEGLAGAIDLLEKASTSPPDNPHTVYLLGQAYCLRGDYQRAITAFEAFSSQRPENPLGWLEMGFANFTWALAMDEPRLPERAELLARGQQALLTAGVDQEVLIDRGDEAYQSKNNQTAWLWYLLADAFGELPTEAADRLTELGSVYQPAPQGRAPLVSGLDLAVIPQPTPTFTPEPTPTPTPIPTPTITPIPTPGPALQTPFGSPGLELLVYEVLEGESFGLIASRYNTTEAVLRALNLRDAPALWVGDIIVVCVGCTETPDLPPLQPLYLEEGISLRNLAALYAAAIEDLRLWNGLGDTDWIEGDRWIVVPFE